MPRSNRICSTCRSDRGIADVHHNHEADHLGRAVEITEWIAHCRRLRNLTRRLKPIYSDNAHRTNTCKLFMVEDPPIWAVRSQAIGAIPRKRAPASIG